MVVKDNEEFIRSYTQHSVLSLMESTSTISFKSTELAATTRHLPRCREKPLGGVDMALVVQNTENLGDFL